MRPVEMNPEYIEKWSIPEPNSGCWLWLGSSSGGKGKTADRPFIHLCRNGKRFVRLAYRTAYEVFRGEIPDGLMVCHTCDTPMCVNPDHLFIGTHLDNMKDMREKQRQVKGGKQHLAKLDEETVRKIRLLRSRYRFVSQVARELGLNYQIVWNVLRGRTWHHVK